MKNIFLLIVSAAILLSCQSNQSKYQPEEVLYSSNPVLDGWYADPEGIIYEDQYWIFPTYSDYYEEQILFNAFSSPDLVNWTKHERILDNNEITWAHKAMWAPGVLEKDGKYYFFFAANDIKTEDEIGGIGVAVSDRPEGPYKDHIGEPLINKIVNGAQPIDQFVFKENDTTYYMFYGGWGYCNVVLLENDFKGIRPFPDGELYKEVTPENFTEGPFMFKKDGKYYFMWSEGGWGNPDYKVAYAISDNPLGPFERIGTILEQDPEVATSAGHHSIIHNSKTDDWYIVYHRRPLEETHHNHRATCIDIMEFDEEGFIKPVKMTFEGVAANPL